MFRSIKLPISIKKENGKIHININLPIVITCNQDIEIIGKNVHIDSISSTGKGKIFLNSRQGSTLRNKPEKQTYLIEKN